MFALKEDKEAGEVTKGQLEELARILACTTCRMPKWGGKIPVRWGGGRKGRIDMSLHHFPT